MRLLVDCPVRLPRLLHIGPTLWVLQRPASNVPESLKAGLMEPVLASGLSLTTFQQGCSAANLLKWATIQASRKAAVHFHIGVSCTLVYHRLTASPAMIFP